MLLDQYELVKILIIAVTFLSCIVEHCSYTTSNNSTSVPITTIADKDFINITSLRPKRATPQKGFFFPIASYTVRHHKPAPERDGFEHPETYEYRGQYFYGYRPKKSSSRRRAARLLAAGLPLLLAPLLSIIFSYPVLVPIATTMTMNGGAFGPLFNSVGRKRRKRRVGVGPQATMKLKELKMIDPRLKELQVVSDYLRQVDYTEKQQSRVMVNYLQCNGLLSTEDHCLERLSCEFSDPANYDAPELERTVTSILLSHMLNNEFIPNPFKRRLKMSAVTGRTNTGSCGTKFYCPYVDQNWDNAITGQPVPPPPSNTLKGVFNPSLPHLIHKPKDNFIINNMDNHLLNY